MIDSNLKAGDPQYMAYVGPPDQYDFMGATQFHLLCTLGLRAHHFLLDFGCGSLRAGRLFLSYLNEGRYFGIEPNKWLIEDAVTNQVGKDLFALKKARFDHNSDFSTTVFSERFDFIIAQSVFSHAGPDLICKALDDFYKSLKADGIIAATFVEGMRDFSGGEWVYPDCVNYRKTTIKRFAREAGFSVLRIPWYHPRQTWYLLAKNGRRLPPKAMLCHLRGAVLCDPEFFESWKLEQRVLGTLKKYLKQPLPQPVKNSLKRLLKKKRSP